MQWWIQGHLGPSRKNPKIGKFLFGHVDIVFIENFTVVLEDHKTKTLDPLDELYFNTGTWDLRLKDRLVLCEASVLLHAELQSCVCAV